MAIKIKVDSRKTTVYVTDQSIADSISGFEKKTLLYYDQFLF